MTWHYNENSRHVPTCSNSCGDVLQRLRPYIWNVRQCTVMRTQNTKLLRVIQYCLFVSSFCILGKSASSNVVYLSTAFIWPQMQRNCLLEHPNPFSLLSAWNHGVIWRPRPRSGRCVECVALVANSAARSTSLHRSRSVSQTHRIPIPNVSGDYSSWKRTVQYTLNV